MPLPTNLDVMDESGAFTPELVYKPNFSFPAKFEPKKQNKGKIILFISLEIMFKQVFDFSSLKLKTNCIYFLKQPTWQDNILAR